MPTYVYRRADGSTFEVTQKISDAKLTEDPETGQPVERVISGGAGLQFKGSGFYLTDYARSGAPSDKASGDAKGSSDASNPADAKPAATPAPSTPAPASGSSD